MSNHLKLFIDGRWVEPAIPVALDVINPATEEPFTQIALGSSEDVDRAVAAAKSAYPAFSLWSKQERLTLLRHILSEYKARYEEIARAVSREMGAPIAFARDSQAAAGKAHLIATIEAREDFGFT